MQTRSLGSEGPTVSEIGFGGWAIGGDWGQQPDSQSTAALHAAIDRGINLIDTAAGYGEGHSEKIIAGVLAERSEDIFVATKTPPTSGPWPPSPYCRWQDRYSAAYLRDNVHQRLQNLKRDRIDLLQLHTWTAAWNDDPQPLLVLRQLKEQGKIGLIGVSAPEHDQACVIQLMRDGLIDTVQVIFNLFQQEAASQILPVAAETGTGVLIRVALDEGSLTGKYGADHEYAESDFRRKFFQGDRQNRTVNRVNEIRRDLERFGIDDQYSLADVALKFVLARPEVSSVLVGMRNTDQVEKNCRVSTRRDLNPEIIQHLHRHDWRRGVWYSGK
jgi:aryl-alcohol dehydrogenase-like predicted oxidoreductase